jgi:hypothetical protein
MKRWASRAVSILLVLLTEACVSFRQATQEFNLAFERGELPAALAALRESNIRNSRNEFLYYANGGLVLSVMGKYEESNAYLEQAYELGEDYRKNLFLSAASFLSNPAITEYRGEDHEHLLVLYYKAINFLKMQKTEEALVECRRLNIRLQQLSDRYENPERYREDAFVHMLMGIIYDMDNDYNNAFIAYRNAYEIYENSYQHLFQISPPEQLRQDLLRTATLAGLADELERWKEEFGKPEYQYKPGNHGQVIFFWHNGLSPVKTERSLNFIANTRNGMVFFMNEDMHMVFPFPLATLGAADAGLLSSVRVFRVAFPRYVERPEYFHTARLAWGGKKQLLAEVQDINSIALHTLEQRMTRELGQALIRVALKQALEQQVRRHDHVLGSVLGVVNALSEQADTRGWQTLPHSIHFARLSLPPGRHQVRLLLEGRGGSQTHEFTYQLTTGQTLFHTFTSLETHQPRYFD